MQKALRKKNSFPQVAGPTETEKAAVFSPEKEVLLARVLAELEQKNCTLRIEEALERVRTRAMGMHHSFEMSDVLSVLFEQYDRLGICPVFSHLTLFDLEHDKFSFLTTGRKGQRVQTEQRIDIDAIDAWKDAVENWKRGGAHTVDCHAYPKELLPQVFGLFQEILSVIPEEARYVPEDFPQGLFITQGYCKFGYVGFGHYRQATDQEKEVVRRMAIEFERLYQRFLDLQKAEEQIREAQIETSLERIRAGAIAMRNSDDVSNATGVLFNELDKLGIPLLRCGLFMVNEKEKTMQVWRAMSTSEGTIGQATGTVSMSIHPMLRKAYDYWKRRETFLRYDLSGEELVSYHAALTKNAPQFTQRLTTEKQTSSCYFFKEGAIFTFSKEPLDAATSAVLQKIAAVFSLTCRRFLDLKNAEAQAREAVKQASLDRIRAVIASMRTTIDLQKITPLIWNELTVLGVPFIRCGVFIMNEQQHLSHTYLSTPDGKAVAAFDLPYTTPGSIGQIVQSWRQKMIYTEYWDKEAYTTFADNLAAAGILSSSDKYLRTLPGCGFYLHFVPFLQGMLYVGNMTLLGNDEIDLIRSVADAFSTAYARYEDFNLLEAAKQQVDKALVDLKQAQQKLIQSEKMASLGQLTAGIAHEIQNPLNFVNNFADTNVELLTELKQALSAHRYKEAMVRAEEIIANEQKIVHHGKRVDSIVKGMLQHSRASNGIKVPTDLNQLTEEYLRLSYQGIHAKDKNFRAVLKTSYDQNLSAVNVIPQDIGRMLLNLFNNAFYAVRQKKEWLNGAFEPTVWVTTKHTGNNVIITVKDNGNGIPEPLQNKIFQPFFTTKPTGQGTGLGLSLSYDIVTEGHGGQIKVVRCEGEGAAFEVELPVNATG